MVAFMAVAGEDPRVCVALCGLSISGRRRRRRRRPPGSRGSGERGRRESLCGSRLPARMTRRLLGDHGAGAAAGAACVSSSLAAQMVALRQPLFDDCASVVFPPLEESRGN